VSEEGAVAYRDAYPSRPGRQSGTHRAILTRTIVHIPDIREDAEYELRALARANDYGCVLSVPMLRDGHPVGAITVGREAARPFSDAQIELLKTFADQAVIAIENVRLFTELQQKNRALTQAHAQVTESLERQTATSEILGVISNAHSDAQPVFDTIVQSAVRLCKATGAAVFLTDGRMLYEPANYGGSPEVLAASRARYPRPLDTDTTAGIAVLTRSVIHVPDTEDPSVTEWMRQSGRLVGFRSVVTVPMLREGDAVGAILVTRRQPGPFSDTEVELLKSFADQAVIAIENVRLFNELQEKNQALTQAHAQVSEALEQQTATSEILRVISQSQTDLHPVFEAIVRSAAQLCEATVAALHRFDGQLVTFEAHHGMTDREIAGSRARFPLPIERGTAVSRAILDARTIHIHEIGRDPEYRVSAWQTSFRTVLAVPLLRDDVPVGAIGLWRREVQPFSEKQIKLVETFADQAVIAIENVRLFTELQEKNRALTAAHAQVTEALDQQTATAEILRVISSSPTDTQPVFEGIARSGVRVCGALGCAVFLIEDDVIRVAATHGVREERLERFRTQFPAAVSAEPEFGKVIREGLFHLADIANNQEATAEQIEYARLAGYRTRLMVPMRRGRDVLGVIAVTREEASPFSDQQVELLKTFADQAVIAIENVRLFKELEARTQDLTRSVGELRALGEVGQAISSTLDLQTVLTTIVGRATHLAGVDAGVIYEYDEQRELFEPRATERLAEDIVRALVATPIRKGEGATGQLAELREPIQVADVRDRAQAFQAREVLVRAGYRAALAVPLVRENRLLGGLTVFRKTPGEFAPEVVDLLRTFATQSALAIQNARLFREIEVKSRQLEVASQHKSEFLANMSHELRTPLNAIIGFSEVLSDRMFGELNEKQEEYLKDIYASGTHLLSLINDILDLSKIEAGRMELELTEFDLPTAIDNALTLIRERAGRRSIALHTDIDGRLGQIQADERKIRQVVLNLLSNAIKFTPEGGRIDVSAEPRDGFVEVSVTDTGIGIAPEDQEKVFEEFRQVGTAAKKIEGTGLGLTLCRKFVELHGGRIWVKSQLGEGSTFTFTIPMRRGE